LDEEAVSDSVLVVVGQSASGEMVGSDDIVVKKLVIGK
jgi:hypothetical protein